MTNKICCYYEEMGVPGQTELIELWLERWKAEGWEAAVIGPDLAKVHFNYQNMIDKAEKFPCATGKGFETANFIRWLAFCLASIVAQGPIAVTDYDVFPIRKFQPQLFEPLPFCGDMLGGPGFIVGQVEHFNWIVHKILDYEVEPDDTWQGKPHICDMRILWKRCKPGLHIRHLISTYGQEGFGTVPLAHYGNASLDAMTDYFRKMTKTEAVKQLLAKHYRID